jgi:hypothetical protein
MAAELAIDLMFEDLVSNLAADGNTARVLFGQRALTATRSAPVEAQARVVVVPGDEKGALGEYGPATKPRLGIGASTPRTLGTLKEVFRVYVWAQDRSVADGHPDYERAQYRAARFLHDQVYRAIFNGRVGTVQAQMTKPQLVQGAVERKAGCELVFWVVLTVKIPDDPGPPSDLDFDDVKPTTGVGPTSLDVEEPGEDDGSDTTAGH